MDLLEDKKCENCGVEHDGSYATGRFCSSVCARGFSTKNKRAEINKKTANTLKNKPIREMVCKKCGNTAYTKSPSPNIYCNECRQKLNASTRKYCNRCGAIKGECKHLKLCRKNKDLFDGLEKYFGFDKTSFGSERYYEEIFRIKAMIEEDYFNNELSIPDLALKYKHPNYGNFSQLLTSLNIVCRSSKEGFLLKFFGNKKIPTSYKYKHGFHTTWDNKQVFYRSSYELDYAKQLDEQKIKYEVETLRVWYFDTQRCIDRIAVPDFYIPETNTIIEIKSAWTYNKQNMNDKINAYRKHGYNFKLILDHKEIECPLV